MAIEKKKVVNKYYTIIKDIDAATKCPPQARLIVETIKAAGERTEREALMTLLRRPPLEGGLTTNQTVERIVGFYKPKLVEMGVLREDTEVIEIDVEVPDKPAPATAAPAATAEVAAPVAEAPAAPAPDKVKDKKGTHKAA